MILDQFENHTLYHSYNPRIRSAFAFLEQHRDGNLPLGKHPIDGENVYAIVMDSATRAESEAIWEVHRKYIDVQYIARGAERMGWAPINALADKLSMPYDPQQDAAFYKTSGTWFEVNQGMFTIFSPSDVHAPSVRLDGCDKVLKIVVKVAVG